MLKCFHWRWPNLVILVHIPLLFEFEIVKFSILHRHNLRDRWRHIYRFIKELCPLPPPPHTHTQLSCTRRTFALWTTVITFASYVTCMSIGPTCYCAHDSCTNWRTITSFHIFWTCTEIYLLYWKKINYSNVKRTCRKKNYYSVFAGLVIRLATQIKNVFKTYFIFEFKTIGYWKILWNLEEFFAQNSDISHLIINWQFFWPL